MTSMLRSTEFRAPVAQGLDFTGATDLAEDLVRRGVPFRVAHRPRRRIQIWICSS
jgi:argininosuccinate lyase